MTQEPTERELELARRLEALEAQAARPTIAGGGIIVESIKAITRMVPPWIITMAVMAFLVFHAWQWTNEAFQLRAETEKLQAQAGDDAAKYEAESQETASDKVPLREAKLRAEIEKATAERDRTQAEVAAQGQLIDGASARFRTLEAELSKAQADAEKAQAEANALTQDAGGGEPLAVAQKRVEVEELESKAVSAVQFLPSTFRIQAVAIKEEQDRARHGSMFDPFYKRR